MLLHYILTHNNYYDSPDGHAPFEKIYGCAKWGFTGGLLLGSFDSIMYSDCKTWKSTFNCLGFWIVPLTAMGAAFASVTYVATNVRGKDDHWNYAIGALASTGILHSWKKSVALTSYGGIAMVLIAMMKKDSVMKGWNFFPTQVEHREVYNTLNWSMVKEPRHKGWVKG